MQTLGQFSLQTNRGCVKTRDGHVFGGNQTLPSTPIVDPELTCEANLRHDPQHGEFSHSLGRKRPAVNNGMSRAINVGLLFPAWIANTETDGRGGTD